MNAKRSMDWFSFSMWIVATIAVLAWAGRKIRAFEWWGWDSAFAYLLIAFLCGLNAWLSYPGEDQ